MNPKTALEELLNQQTIIKDRIRAVIYKQANGFYLHGRPGSSKTYMVRTILEQFNVPHGYASGHLTPIGFFDLLSENSDRVLVLDDVSSLFNQAIALQLLLAALGTSHDGSRTRKVRHKTAKGDQIVHFSGSIVAISNLPLAGHNKQVMEALNDRIYVVNYDPSDEQLLAQIQKIALTGPRGVNPKDALMVADFLSKESKALGVRPSIRLFIDKALVDFQLWKVGKTEADWKDLIRSSLEQQATGLRHETRDLSRADQVDSERRIALSIYLEHEDRQTRLAAWSEKTGKGQSAFYRRLDELKKDGQLPVNV